jgi:hypothetical protein
MSLTQFTALIDMLAIATKEVVKEKLAVRSVERK